MAVAGLKSPVVGLTPGPDQVPPPLGAERYTGGELLQNGPAGFMVAFGGAVLTVT